MGPRVAQGPPRAGSCHHFMFFLGAHAHPMIHDLHVGVWYPVLERPYDRRRCQSVPACDPQWSHPAARKAHDDAGGSTSIGSEPIEPASPRHRKVRGFRRSGGLAQPDSERRATDPKVRGSSPLLPAISLSHRWFVWVLQVGSGWGSLSLPVRCSIPTPVFWLRSSVGSERVPPEDEAIGSSPVGAASFHLGLKARLVKHRPLKPTIVGSMPTESTTLLGRVHAAERPSSLQRVHAQLHA